MTWVGLDHGVGGAGSGRRYSIQCSGWMGRLK